MFATWILPKECHSLFLSCSRSYLNNSISVPQMKFEDFWAGPAFINCLMSLEWMSPLCAIILSSGMPSFSITPVWYTWQIQTMKTLLLFLNVFHVYTQVYTLYVYITYIYLYFPPLSVFVRLRWSYHLSNSDLCLVSDSCSKHFYPFKD